LLPSENNFGIFCWPWNGKIWYILRPFGMLMANGIFYGHLVNAWFVETLSIFPVLVCFTKKNLATQRSPKLMAYLHEQ
jgi:hypothetical protein